MSRKLLVSIALLSGTGAALADDVTVGGVTFPTTLERTVGSKSARMVMSGAGVRERYFLNIYAMASYADETSGVKDASALAAADCPKCLHLVMLRGLNGRDMAAAFTEAIRLNYPAPALQTELDQLAATISQKSTRKGDNIVLTHLPGVGLQCDFAGQVFIIRNVEFARAVWKIYLGPRNLGEKLKRALVSRL